MEDALENANESLDLLLEFEKKYCNSSKLVNSQMMYWHYKVMGNKSWKKVVPEIDHWVYHYERFLSCDGDLYKLKQADTFFGRYF